MGGMLGGGSSINFMMYTRAQGIDFDSWETEGWTATEMLPMCNKLETYHPKGEGHDQSKHGHDGPINISDGGYRGKSEDQFVDTVKKMGFNYIEDLQDLEANGGFSVSYLHHLNVVHLS
jgi:alcohol oxidase